MDGDGLLSSGGFVEGTDLQNAVGVNVKADLDLGNATGGGGDAGELEAAQGFIALGHFPFALEDVDFDEGLVVFRR